MYTPEPGSNIEAVYNAINCEPKTAYEIKQTLKLSNPQVPDNSISTHLRYLVKKDVVIKEGDEFRRPSDKDSLPMTQQILLYCKKHIGQKVTSTRIREELGFKKTESAPASVLGVLQKIGVVQLIPNTRPFEYLILSEIKALDSVPYAKVKKQKEIATKESVVEQRQDDIANLSIGQILTEYVTIKQENLRLREALQRIAHELVQVGELE